MNNANYYFQRNDTECGPFDAGEIAELIADEVITARQILTTSAGERLQAIEVRSGHEIEDISPPDTPGQIQSPSWNPRLIACLTLVFSPAWSGVMAAVNAKRLNTAQPFWRPVIVGVTAIAFDIALRFFGLDFFFISWLLFFGAAWCIWHFDLRPQIAAHEMSSKEKGASWILPAFAGAPLALFVFGCFVVAPLMPDTPGYILANNAGIEHLEQGNLDEALDSFEEAARENPDFAVAHLNVGFVFFQQGKSGKARAAFDRAISLDSSESSAYLYRGLTFNELGQFDAAIDDFDNALEDAETATEALNGRGVARWGKGRVDDAILDFTRAIEQNSEFLPAYENRAAAYMERSDFEQAIQDCSKALNVEPDVRTFLLMRGVAYRQLGKFDNAIQDYGRLIEKDNRDAEAYNLRGVAFLDKGESNRAIADFDKAIRIKPDFRLAKDNRRIAKRSATAAGVDAGPSEAITKSPFSDFSFRSYPVVTSSTKGTVSTPRQGTAFQIIWGGKGAYYLLVKSGLGKKILVGLGVIWMAILGLRKWLSASGKPASTSNG